MNQELIQSLRQIKCLFDDGVTIEIGDEGFTILGYDYLGERENVNIVRRYFVPFTTDDADNYYDTLEPVLNQIRKETLELSL